MSFRCNSDERALKHPAGVVVVVVGGGLDRSTNPGLFGELEAAWQRNRPVCWLESS